MVTKLFPNGLSYHMLLLSRPYSYHISFDQGLASSLSIHGVITAGTRRVVKKRASLKVSL